VNRSALSTASERLPYTGHRFIYLLTHSCCSDSVVRLAKYSSGKVWNLTITTRSRYTVTAQCHNLHRWLRHDRLSFLFFSQWLLQNMLITITSLYLVCMKVMWAWCKDVGGAVGVLHVALYDAFFSLMKIYHLLKIPS